MSVRIRLLEGDLASEVADALVFAVESAPELAVGSVEVTQSGTRIAIRAAATPAGGAATEASVRGAMRSALAAARARSARSLAVPALGAGAGLSMQRSAEILLDEARAHAAEETSLEEIRFVLSGEPAYRMFEMVNDAARVADQLAQLRQRRRPA
jgi:O-acetyl-ADP-ribose deacetylase (regulator of RNase III)